MLVETLDFALLQSRRNISVIDKVSEKNASSIEKIIQETVHEA